MDLRQTISECLRTLFEQCGENFQREGLQKTPLRVLKAFEELTQGYRQTLEEIVNGALFECDNKAPVWVENIPFFSLCEHHLLPFFGHCTIAYLPNGKVLGVSKIYRIVNLFARRLQLQERLTQQIGTSLLEVTGAKGVLVEMTGEHLCVAMRGVQRSQSKMRTFYRFGEPIDAWLTPSSSATSELHKSNDTGNFRYSMTGKKETPYLSDEASEMPYCAVNSCVCTDVETDPNGDSKNVTCDVLSGLLTIETKEFPLKIGCYSEEQTRTTLVKMILELRLPNNYGTIADDLTSTVDYDALAHYLIQTVLPQRFQLLEYACKEIYRAIQRFLQIHGKRAHFRVTLVKSLSHTLLQNSRFTYGDF